MDRETIVYEYRMNGMGEDDAEVHADIYCSKLDELANLRAENERLREVLANLLKLAKMNEPNAGFPQAEEALR